MVSVSGILQLMIRVQAKAIKEKQNEQEDQARIYNSQIEKMESKLDQNSERMNAILSRQKKQDEYLDKKSYSDSIPLLIKNKMIEVLENNFVTNREFIVQATSAANKISETVKSIMKSDFPENTPFILEYELVSSAKEIRTNLNGQNLNMKDHSVFLNDVKKQAVLPAIRHFTEKTREILTKKNGDRLEAFQNLSLDFTENMTKKIIQFMQNH